MQRDNNHRGLIQGVVAGSLAGVALGLLVAPKTGKEARQVVLYKTSSYVNKFRQRSKEQ